MIYPTPATLKDTLFETLDIRVLDASPDRVVLEMDVGPKVHQPMGLLHGGASAAMAESAASMGSMLSCDLSKEYPVGIELSISHLRGRRDGLIRADAIPVRKGRTLHVWNIEIVDGDGGQVAQSRCTVLIRPLHG